MIHMGNDNGEGDVVEFGEVIDQEAEKLIFEKNHERTIALGDLWLNLMSEKIMESDAPVEKKLEMMFVMTTNSLLDLMMGSQPEEVSLLIAKNLDEYLRVALVNKKYDTNLMQSFQDEFFESHGEEFETEDDLDRALETFDANWWNTKRDELGGTTPNRAVKEISEEFKI
jgi:hypothetical protein